MALSETTLQQLRDAKAALEEYKLTRVGEIDDLVANLKAYGVPLDSLSTGTTEAAATDALASIQALLE